MSSETIPLRSMEMVNNAWVAVEEENSDTAMEEDLPVLRKRLTTISPSMQPMTSIQPQLDDASSDDGDDECHCEHKQSSGYDDEDEQTKVTSCCNVKGVGQTLAEGFCNVFSTIVSCIREKITKKQMFLLVGAVVAAVFKTNNVAVSSTSNSTIDDTIGSTNDTTADAVVALVSGDQDGDGMGGDDDGNDNSVLGGLAKTIVDVTVEMASSSSSSDHYVMDL
uniref:Wsv295-like protein n=1 Tax=Pasiphaea japonica whispovirus TaxID=2984286 RepID=A0A9C7BJC4_9VIRU|nr:MAG: wsv295-like protein [Pasiphaea japonica whispovirus]